MFANEVHLRGDVSLANNSMAPLLELMNQVSRHAVRGKAVRINLQDMTFIYPSGIAMLIAAISYLRSHSIDTKIGPPAENVHSYLIRIGFYELIGEAMEYPWNQHDARGRFLEIRQVHREDEGETVVQNMLTILRTQARMGRGIDGALQYALMEVVNNVFHHAHSSLGAFLCAQFYPTKKLVELAVVDVGRGIPASLGDNSQLREEFHTAAEAIRLAVKPRVTGRPDHNTGEGLFFTMELIKHNGGVAYIQSQDGRLKIEKNQITPQQVPVWPGTAVSLRFRTDRPIDTTELFNQYAPPEDDYSFFFDEDTGF